MMRMYQRPIELNANIQGLKENINLQRNNNELYVCHERIVEDYPIFISRPTLLVEKWLKNIIIKPLMGKLV